jgi:glycosyltransferase involved in cell wall biosynthesis
MAAPVVSVITTVYNGHCFLDACVRSVLDEAEPALELVVVSDGSTDGTEGYLEGLADPRVTTAIGPRRGRAAALNDAIGRSRGRYLAILDADDVALPGRFARSMAYLDAHPDVVAVGSASWVHIDGEGHELGRRHLPVETDGAIREMLRHERVPFPHSTVTLRREAVEAVGGYDEHLVHAADLDLYVRLAPHGQFAALAEPLAASRRHDGQFFARRQGEAGSIRRRIATRRTIDRRAAEVFGGHPTRVRAAAHEAGSWAYWRLRALAGDRPVLPTPVRRRLDRLRVGRGRLAAPEPDPGGPVA